MRYLLHKTQLTELQARQQYLYDVFRMFFLPGNQERNFVPLRPVGSYNLDVLFITGHTNYVEDFLRRSFESISENIIVITSCMGLSFQKYTSKKDIYVPDASIFRMPNYTFIIHLELFLKKYSLRTSGYNTEVK